MNLRTITFLLICVLGSSSCAKTNILGMIENQKKESLVFNESVTDEEIIEFFEMFLKYQPTNLEYFKRQIQEERNLFLKNYRKLHEDAGIKIPILRGLSKDEIGQFEEIAKHKAAESIRIDSAQKRLLSFSKDQYKLMINEARKLISNYDEYRKDERSKRVVISGGFPDKLLFLDLESIYLYQSHCYLLLQNGIGRDIGYYIGQDKGGAWFIKSFDHYKSWQSNRIDLN